MIENNVTFLKELKVGEVIPSDIYFNKILLIKAGTEIDESLLRNLKNWGISKINSLYIKDPEEVELSKTYTNPLNNKEKIFYSRELFDIKELFFESLQYVVSEPRYGLILNRDEQISWLENLFVSSLLNAEVSIALHDLKEKDPYSYYHSFDVFLLGSLLADLVGMKDIQSFAMGCLLHDIGKLETSNELLQKEGALSKAEFDEIQKHTMNGVKFVEKNNLPQSIKELVQSHHERLDGTGYPEGLTATELSEEVKLLAVVDTYSALTLQRAYREAFTSIKAIELMLNKGKKYDIKYVIHIMELINIYPIDSIVRLSNGKKAKVKSVHENQPYFPVLEEVDNNQVYQLPLNFSVFINRFVKWDQIEDESNNHSKSHKEKYWNSLISQILLGNMDEANERYNQVTDGMSLNNIFIDVMIPLIKEIETRKNGGELSTGEEHDAFIKIKDILIENFK